MHETKNLDIYVKKYDDNIQLCTIGEVENAASVNKGGMHRYKNKTKRKNKNKSKRRTYKYIKHRKATKKYKMKQFTRKTKK